jgi:hypothetical protein
MLLLAAPVKWVKGKPVPTGEEQIIGEIPDDGLSQQREQIWADLMIARMWKAGLLPANER